MHTQPAPAQQPVPVAPAKTASAAPEVAPPAPMEVSYRKPDQIEKSASDETEGTVSEVSEQVEADDRFPLRLGSQGPRVERLQVWLQRNLGHFGVINDRFEERLLPLLRKALGTEELSRYLYKKHRMNQHIQRQRPLHEPG